MADSIPLSAHAHSEEQSEIHKSEKVSKQNKITEKPK